MAVHCREQNYFFEWLAGGGSLLVTMGGDEGKSLCADDGTENCAEDEGELEGTEVGTPAFAVVQSQQVPKNDILNRIHPLY